MRGITFLLLSIGASVTVFVVVHLIGNAYVFFAGYVVLQFIVMATAWNILGGYAGYVSFGSAAFFAFGAYSSVAFEKLVPVPVPVLILAGGLVSALVGLCTGYLTMRLRGVFFSIATLAMAIVARTLIENWDFVGAARGAYIVRPRQAPLIGGDYVEYLFLVMLALSVVAVATARAIERSDLGLGFAALRDDELAAEAMGVPTLRLKLIAAAASGGLMGMAGAPLPYYVTYLDPSSAFSLSYAINTIAMPLIGGTSNWIGPVIGAVIVAALQQVATVTISPTLGLLIVGLMLVCFVTVAPNGILGLIWPRDRE